MRFKSYMNTLKKIKFIVIFFVFNGNAQSLDTKRESKKIEIIYYQAITNKDITKSDTPKILNDITYVLRFTNIESTFFNIPKMDSDAYRSNERYVVKSGASGIFYKNLKTKEKYKSINLMDENFLVISEIQEDKWVLTKETKKIDEFKCYKALYKFSNSLVPNRSLIITAWYSIELPFPFGPIGFDGLPGIILELNFLDYTFVAKKISFDKKFDIVKPEGKIVTNNELNNYFKKKTGIDIEKKLKYAEKKEVKKENKRSN